MLLTFQADRIVLIVSLNLPLPIILLRAIRTNVKKKARDKSELSDYIILQENRENKPELRIRSESIDGSDRRAILYVFGIWAAFDEGIRPILISDKQEIKEETELSGAVVNVFLSKMGPSIKEHDPNRSGDPAIINERKAYSRRRVEGMEFETNEGEL